MDAAKLAIPGGSELRTDKVALVGKEKYRRSVRYQVDTGPCSQAGNGIGLPHFTTGPSLKANKKPSGSRAVNEIISEKRRRGIAENAPGSGCSFGPENLGRRLVRIELKHQPADKQPVAMKDRS